jgi:16S rRNA processing protein RimM
MTDSPGDEAHLIVGRIRKPHGLRGAVVVELHTDEPGAVFAPGRRVLMGNAAGILPPAAPALTVVEVGGAGSSLRIQFAEIGDRESAEMWRDRFLFASAGELIPPSENEVYLHELDGMRVELSSGEPVGTVIGLFEMPQGLMLEVSRDPGGTAMVPYDHVVVALDREARVIRIDPPEGLLD